MTNLNFNNDGSEETRNSSKNVVRGLSCPKNDSLLKSCYTVALDKYLGMRGLVSPVKDTRCKRVYHYDFLHVESETAIKIFTTLDELEMARYHNRTEDVKTCFIIDASHLCDDLRGGYEEEDIEHVAPPEVIEAAQELNAYIYINGFMWQWSESPEPDIMLWWTMTPLERIKGNFEYMELLVK